MMASNIALNDLFDMVSKGELVSLETARQCPALDSGDDAWVTFKTTLIDTRDIRKHFDHFQGKGKTDLKQRKPNLYHVFKSLEALNKFSSSENFSSHYSTKTKYSLSESNHCYILATRLGEMAILSECIKDGGCSKMHTWLSLCQHGLQYANNSYHPLQVPIQ
jgi:hypothetical protein